MNRSHVEVETANGTMSMTKAYNEIEDQNDLELWLEHLEQDVRILKRDHAGDQAIIPDNDGNFPLGSTRMCFWGWQEDLRKFFQVEASECELEPTTEVRWLSQWGVRDAKPWVKIPLVVDLLIADTIVKDEALVVYLMATHMHKEVLMKVSPNGGGPIAMKKHDQSQALRTIWSRVP